MYIIVGFYENDKCCKIRQFNEDSSKVWENCLLIISENSNFGKNGNLARIYQRFGKNYNKMTKEGCL